MCVYSMFELCFTLSFHFLTYTCMYHSPIFVCVFVVYILIVDALEEEFDGV